MVMHPGLRHRLERPKEVDDVLSLLSFQPVEMFDYSGCLAAWTSVGLDSLHQIACPPVMEEEHALPNTPQRSCSELIGARTTLRDAVRKTSTHVVDEEVGEQIHRLIGKRGLVEEPLAIILPVVNVGAWQ